MEEKTKWRLMFLILLINLALFVKPFVDDYLGPIQTLDISSTPIPSQGDIPVDAENVDEADVITKPKIPNGYGFKICNGDANGQHIKVRLNEIRATLNLYGITVERHSRYQAVTAEWIPVSVVRILFFLEDDNASIYNEQFAQMTMRTLTRLNVQCYFPEMRKRVFPRVTLSENNLVGTFFCRSPRLLEHLEEFEVVLADDKVGFYSSLQICKKQPLESKNKLGICSIPLYGETLSSAIILQWIEYHILYGVEHFYIYDRNKNFAKDLQYLIKKNIVTLVSWPNYIQNATGHDNVDQIIAYNHCHQVYGYANTWLLFTSIEEYIDIPTVNSVSDASSTLIGMLKRQSENATGGVIAVQRWNFGGMSIASTIKEDNSKIVVEFYTRRAAEHLPTLKLFTKTNAVLYQHVQTAELDDRHDIYEPTSDVIRILRYANLFGMRCDKECQEVEDRGAQWIVEPLRRALRLSN